MHTDQESIVEIASQIVKSFPSKGLSVCAAESCTGGLVASSIVSVPDASKIFKGSAVCYCDEAKVKVLGVAKETLDKYFAESPQCAVEMAEGALALFDADVAVSATGFLDANTPIEKASLADTVFIGIALKGDGNVLSQWRKIKLEKDGDRNENRKYVALQALKLILEIEKK